MGTTTRIALAAAALLAAGSARAATVAFDTGLVDPPGTYFGSGNANTHWTTDTENGVELGLQTLIRYTGPAVAPTAPTNAIYNVPLGINVDHGGALWDFAFSFNGKPTALSTPITLNQITTTLTMTDFGNHTTGSFDALIIPDNDKWGPGGKNSGSDTTATQYGFQNAETPSFASIAFLLGDPGFDPNQNDTYLVTFSATCAVGATACAPGQALGTVSELINAGTGAVPEPGTLALLGVACLGLLGVRRRRTV